MVGRASAQFVQRAFSGPRTLANDALSKVVDPKVQVQGLADDTILKGTNGKVVEVHAFPNEHSESLVMVYLPAEKCCGPLTCSSPACRSTPTSPP